MIRVVYSMAAVAKAATKSGKRSNKYIAKKSSSTIASTRMRNGKAGVSGSGTTGQMATGGMSTSGSEQTIGNATSAKSSLQTMPAVLQIIQFLIAPGLL